MQTINVDPPIVITGRHVTVTDAIRDYARKKVQSLHLDYPRIMEAKVVLDVNEKHGAPRHFAEIVLFCTNNITIEADSVCGDLYNALDETISKVARRMRKYKTRILNQHRPSKGTSRYLDMQVFDAAHLEVEDAGEIEPIIIHPEKFEVRPFFPDEAITALELSDKNFTIFHNQKNDHLSLLYRRKDGDYAMIDMTVLQASKAAS
jgi:putative sigma-54 modulation protein